MDNGIEFFTATCVNWQPLLKLDERKDIVMGLCLLPEDYDYSSARYYELNIGDWGFITHYAEHL
jgi:hypothetical protein